MEAYFHNPWVRLSQEAAQEEEVEGTVERSLAVRTGMGTRAVRDVQALRQEDDSWGVAGRPIDDLVVVVEGR